MKERRIVLALIAYGSMAALAIGWGALLHGDIDLYHHPDPWLPVAFPVSTALALVAGVGVALSVLVGTRVLVRHARWARDLHGEFRALLGPLTTAEIVVFSLSSGISEELFFRGALQPTLGLILSSLLFGAVHVGPIRRFWPWTVWATLMGFVFAALYAATGEILAPVVAHILINYENMHFIAAHDPGPPGRNTDASLVSRVERPR